MYVEHYSMKKFIISSVLSTVRIKYVERIQTILQRINKLNSRYSTNNISIVTERQYKLKMIEKIKELVMKTLFWTELYTTHNYSKNIMD